MNILILQGGNSPEREVSLRSGEAVARAAKALGHTVITYDTQTGSQGLVSALKDVDVVFPALHGLGGEDGTIQQILEDHGVNYVGSGPESSKNCFDKIITKQMLEANGIPTPRWEEVDSYSFTTSPLLKQPYVLKPRFGGSSIDTFIVRDPAKHKQDMTVFNRHNIMLLEELVEGTELTVSVLGDETLPVIEIVPPNGGEFDYTNKYNGKTKEFCPPQHISQSLQEEAQDLAAQAHAILGARHLSRIDLIMSKHGELSVLEINTIPGLTDQSLFPKAAATADLPMDALVERLLEMAVSET